MKSILSPLKKNIKTLILIIILLVLEAYFTLCLPEYTAKIVDVGIANSDMACIYNAGTSMLIFTLLATVTAIFADFFSSRFASQYTQDLRIIIFSKVLKFSNHELNDIPKSSLITRTTNDVSYIQKILEGALDTAIIAPIMAIGGIIRQFSLEQISIGL